MRTYNKKFARSQWRKSFGGNRDQFRFLRHAGQSQSFRIFTGRCQE